MQASPSHPDRKGLGTHVTRGLREGALFLLGAVACYLLLALLTYSPSDAGWSHSGQSDQVANLGGQAGAWFADIFLYVFGYTAFLLPFMVAYAGLVAYRWEREHNAPSRIDVAFRAAGFVLTVTAGAGLSYLHFTHPTLALPLNAGGVLGEVVGGASVRSFSMVGSTLLLTAVFLGGVSLFTGLSWIWLMDATGDLTLRLFGWARERYFAVQEWIVARRARQERQETVKVAKEKTAKRPPPRIEPKVVEPPKLTERVEKERQVPLFEFTAEEGLPPLNLLDPATPSGKEISPDALQAMSRLVEMKLGDFGVEVQVVEVHPGPVITRFEMQPAAGVKVSQITNLSKDLARALSTMSVRVVEVIPGKTTVGLEIPNEHRELVRLSETLQSAEYADAKSPLTLALGKDISGKPMVADLAKMPHLLVAGTTGSGKSVAINAMILSLLYNATARDVRLIMVDPKMLELSVYEGIPHLLAPVVTDMKDAANALRWCVAEMDRRYRLMAALGVRNISGFNKKVKDAIAAKQPIPDPTWKPMVPDAPELEADRPTLDSLPYIVVVVDELADMMMVVGKKVEELIARLAQKARASGIHLILATQRPSVDVITGLIKANIPTRIAFQVSSRIDSRTILDQMGAESLLGHGDMLYMAPGHGVPMRVHGAFVSDEEVHRVVQNLKSRGAPNYLSEIVKGGSDSGDEGGFGEGGGGGEGGEADELYDQAVRIVTESRRASVSGIQRRLKIGYNRAARLVEDMERAGIVGPLQTNGSREVLAPPPPED